MTHTFERAKIQFSDSESSLAHATLTADALVAVPERSDINIESAARDIRESLADREGGGQKVRLLARSLLGRAGDQKPTVRAEKNNLSLKSNVLYTLAAIVFVGIPTAIAAVVLLTFLASLL